MVLITTDMQQPMATSFMSKGWDVESYCLIGVEAMVNRGLGGFIIETEAIRLHLNGAIRQLLLTPLIFNKVSLPMAPIMFVLVTEPRYAGVHAATTHFLVLAQLLPTQIIALV